MKLIMRYLKPFTITLLISIVFLFVQVLSDLGLPRLMSDLVDTGIQAGGIEQRAPDQISAEGLTVLQPYLHERDYAELRASYSSSAGGVNQRGERAVAVDDAYIRAVFALGLSSQVMQQAASNDAAAASESGMAELEAA